MTEVEWLTDRGFSSLETWRFIEKNTSYRKRRLFGVACCRHILRLIPPDARHLLEVIEEAIDARPFDEDIALERCQIANDEAAAAVIENLVRVQRQVSEISRRTNDRATHAACNAVSCAASIYGFDETPQWTAGHAVNASWLDGVKTGRSNPQSQYEVDPQEDRAQMILAREIFGNPFRSVSLTLSWLHWNDATVPRIAQSIYDARDFSLLPILADALEEAGCDHADILNHCRQPGEHVRGCWVVDLLLGKS